jgi:signal transduction histidine kinase
VFEEDAPVAAPAYSRVGRKWRDSLHKLFELIRDTKPPPEQQAYRLKTVERNIVLPVKFLLVCLVAYFVFSPVTTSEGSSGQLSQSAGLTNVANAKDFVAAPSDTFNQSYRALRWMLLAYVGINIPVALILMRPRAFRLRLRHVQSIILLISSIDSLFVACLTYLTEGFASLVYWLFAGLILRNSISLPLARPQLLLNLLTVLLYTSAGLLDISLNPSPLADPGNSIESSVLMRSGGHSATEAFVLRIVLLFVLTFCCYSLQVLLEKQRQTEEDARELTTRQQQLDVAARLAAQIAHQIKNPLGIISNTVYNLERSVRAGKPETTDHQLQIIREEVTRADQVITRLMGYAQLKEGRVEKLDVVEELERALHDVFPPVAKYQIRIIREFTPELPHLWMQRQHLGDVFNNLLTNAREALFGQGEIRVVAERSSKDMLRVTIVDNGPGIPPERLNQVFQPYFTTKDKGSGLGLAIVRQNLNLYGATIKVESELGKGARFVITFPIRVVQKASV